VDAGSGEATYGDQTCEDDSSHGITCLRFGERAVDVHVALQLMPLQIPVQYVRSNSVVGLARVNLDTAAVGL
jgi:hypothetical protein